MSLLSVRGLTKEYKGREVIRNISFDVMEGEIFGIVGPSGSGKSTLLRIIDLLEPPTSGEIVFKGIAASALDLDAFSTRRSMSLVLQKPSAMNRSVRRNIAYGLELRALKEEEIERKVDRYIELLKLEEMKDRNARSLSGGEMQRMCFARSVVVEPNLMMFDEFTANLDPQNVAILEEALKELMKVNSRSAMVVTHNIFQARRLCDRLAFLMNGELVEIGQTERMFRDPSDVRTRSFLSGEMVY